MAKAKCAGRVRVCVPTRFGFYWATNRQLGWRGVVQVAKNGYGKRRVYIPARKAGYGLEEFRDYVGPLTEPEKPKK